MRDVIVKRDQDSEVIRNLIEQVNGGFSISTGRIVADPGLATYLLVGGFSQRELWVTEVLLGLESGSIVEPSTEIGLVADNTGSRGNVPAPGCSFGFLPLGCKFGKGLGSICGPGSYYKQVKCIGGNHAASCVLGASPGSMKCFPGMGLALKCSPGIALGGGCSPGLKVSFFSRDEDIEFKVGEMFVPPEPPEPNILYPYYVTGFNELIDAGHLGLIQYLPADTKEGVFPFPIPPGRQLWFTIDSAEADQIIMNVHIKLQMTPKIIKPNPSY